MDNQVINWGIIGPGRIAGKVAHDMLLSRSSCLYAVASRNIDKAKEFQAAYSAKKSYGSYGELLEDPSVDVVYIATPHHLHYPLILSCLDHGKSVLCEKPFCLNSLQVEKVIEKQKKTGLFVMEALWTRFIPAYQELRALLTDESCRISSVYADLGFEADYNISGRLFNPALAGGSLLDCGIYPLFLATDLLGEPDKVFATANFRNQVDISTFAMLSYPEGQVAQVSSDFSVMVSMEANIHTNKGVFSLPARWIDMDRFSLINKVCIEIHKHPKTGIGYFHELEHVNQCLTEGLGQSPVYPLTRTLMLSKQLDRIREEISLKYPKEIEMA